MAQRVRISGGDIAGHDNEAYDANVDKTGSLWVREVAHASHTNKSYEDTSFVSGDSPATHAFYTDTGRNATDGWIKCDGPGDITVDFSANGLTYGDSFTVKNGEVIDVLRMSINKVRITHSGTDSAYRIFLI